MQSAVGHIRTILISKKQIPLESFERLKSKLVEKKTNFLAEASNNFYDKSNLKKQFYAATQLALKLATAWSSGDIHTQEKLQSLVFPCLAGITGDDDSKKNDIKTA